MRWFMSYVVAYRVPPPPKNGTLPACPGQEHEAVEVYDPVAEVGHGHLVYEGEEHPLARVRRTNAEAGDRRMCLVAWARLDSGAAGMPACSLAAMLAEYEAANLEGRAVLERLKQTAELLHMAACAVELKDANEQCRARITQLEGEVARLRQGSEGRPT
jgi:hypothetical protein